MCCPREKIEKPVEPPQSTWEKYFDRVFWTTFLSACRNRTPTASAEGVSVLNVKRSEVLGHVAQSRGFLSEPRR